MNFENLSLDDLVCLYNCVENEINRISIASIPNTLRIYFNQLNKLLSIVHKDILKKEKEVSFENMDKLM